MIDVVKIMPIYKNGDDWGMVYGIVLTTLILKYLGMGIDGCLKTRYTSKTQCCHKDFSDAMQRPHEENLHGGSLQIELDDSAGSVRWLHCIHDMSNDVCTKPTLW